MTRALLRRLPRDRRGVAAIEFAIVAPVTIILMMSLSELTYQGYLQAALTGAVQKAARDSTIEGNGTDASAATIDGAVKTAIAKVVSPVVWDTTSRQNVAHFADIGPEYYWDTNKNGKYDPTECFVDTNGNSAWDADPSTTGQAAPTRWSCTRWGSAIRGSRRYSRFSVGRTRFISWPRPS